MGTPNDPFHVVPSAPATEERESKPEPKRMVYELNMPGCHCAQMHQEIINAISTVSASGLRGARLESRNGGAAVVMQSTTYHGFQRIMVAVQSVMKGVMHFVESDSDVGERVDNEGLVPEPVAA